MTRQLEPLDISDLPDVVRLVEEVREAHAPRVLRWKNEDVAVLMPAPARKRRRRRDRKPSEKDLEIFRSSAGGWADMDTETLKANIYADRRASNKPPPEL